MKTPWACKDLILAASLLSNYMFLFGGGAAAFGWFAYTPLSDAIHSP